MERNEQIKNKRVPKPSPDFCVQLHTTERGRRLERSGPLWRCDKPSESGKKQRMGRSGRYREFASRCLEIARATENAQTKAVMLQMAQVWSRLAEDTDALPDDDPLSRQGNDDSG
jgi:hypothetical protein